MAASYNLSEDLLTEIMKRLPVKSILRCRCVRKSWYHLLRSPYFLALHSRNQNSLHKYLLFFNRNEKYFSLRFDDEQCKEYRELRVPQEMDRDCKFMGPVVYETCNGIICLSWTEKVWLWNPALRVFDVLPDSPVPPNDTLNNHTTRGLAFGYLAKTNDYKVVKYEKYFGGDKKTEVYVYVYSLGTDRWKTVKKDKFGKFAGNKVSNSVVVNGVAYWAANNTSWCREKVIVCFDMERDTMREIRLPPPLCEESGCNDVLVENSSGELLSLFYHDRSSYVLHIWELENAGGENEGWTLKKSLNFEQIRQPIGFRNNGEIVLKNGEKFLSYDVEKNEAKDIVDDDSLDAFYWIGHLHPYHHQGLNRFEETLVLLDVNRQA